ncbi:hypothetical protein LQ567_14910 [Niabella pedocola]|uniref:Uncharacterized protein n=1 Tax=Niabella pedocola TaxID=1752077 RepID=A0ABS8PUW0_9BACT|nr:hypothetical protein [Niabella pedocola]MCD2424067.1 hypothetical protein [Niabella pedocola]
MYYKDYIDQILQNYEQKKAAGNLSLNLSAPTPAQLRDECLIVCMERLEQKDAQTLRTFFGKTIDQKTCRHTIEHFDINRFRPLINFLETPTIDTNHKNVELLAWLINFEPRPLDRWEKKEANKPDKAAIPDSSPEETDNEAPGGPGQTKAAATAPPEDTAQADPSGSEAASMATPLAAKDNSGVLSTALQAPGKPRFHFKTITIPLAAVAMASASLPVYNYIKEAFSNADACMYWTGDHYQSVPCNQKIYGSLIIPLDTEKLFHFKKITRPDTITEAGINRISYIRLNGGIEYYTRKGDHPVFTEKSLRPLTEHMYETHIRPLKQ